ncbi:MAG TPA: amidohydrolase family protein [Candidatus Hydrogenedentes bacterium]|nr:MAG: Amidohydrolase [Chloroflexi bacterium ADurb.Bin325]HPV36059.1 amidohydrolase family protein [Candidatus Hydrogenedentota bacterium]
MFIDIHVHASPRRHPEITRANGSHYPDAETLIQMMDNAHIDKACIMAGVSPECRYTVVTVEDVVGLCAQYPDRLIPFCNLDPRYLTNDASADFSNLLGAFKDMGCKGVGECTFNLPFDDPRCLNLFEAVEDAGLPLTFHIGPEIGGCYGIFDDPGLPRLENVLKTFPGLMFLGHSQAFWAEIGANVVEDGRRLPYPKGPVEPGRVVELMRAYPNLLGDLSAGSGYNAISRDPEFGCAFLEEFQDRLFWGTDIANDPQDLPIVAWFDKLKTERLISEDAFEKITWKNANRLLGLGLA